MKVFGGPGVVRGRILLNWSSYCFGVDRKFKRSILRFETNRKIRVFSIGRRLFDGKLGVFRFFGFEKI